jgi:hypothetical protein
MDLWSDHEIATAMADPSPIPPFAASERVTIRTSFSRRPQRRRSFRMRWRRFSAPQQWTRRLSMHKLILNGIAGPAFLMLPPAARCLLYWTGAPRRGTFSTGAIIAAMIVFLER